MKIIPYLAFVVFCVIGINAQASSYVVVESGAGSEYAPGDMIEGQRSITLGEDNQLTLINSFGKKISVNGREFDIIGIGENRSGRANRDR